jgi:hypothetical protein
MSSWTASEGLSRMLYDRCDYRSLEVELRLESACYGTHYVTDSVAFHLFILGTLSIICLQ